MTTRSRRNQKYVSQNRNAVIRTRETRNGRLRTETFRRDESSLSAAVSTCPRSDSTQMFIDFPDGDRTVRLDGRQARTLYRLLQKHYRQTNKSY